MTEVLNFSVVKDDKQNYRIAKDGSKYYLQRQTKRNGFISYVNESDNFWNSVDAVVASSNFQNLFK